MLCGGVNYKRNDSCLYRVQPKPNNHLDCELNLLIGLQNIWIGQELRYIQIKLSPIYKSTYWATNYLDWARAKLYTNLTQSNLFKLVKIN